MTRKLGPMGCPTPRPTPMTRLAVRLPDALVRRIDDYAQQLAVDVPGVAFSRSAAIRALIEKALRE